MQQEQLLENSNLDSWLYKTLKPDSNSILNKYKKTYFVGLYLNGVLGSVWTIPVTLKFWQEFLSSKKLSIAFTSVSSLSSIFLFSRLTDLTIKKLKSNNDLIQRSNNYYKKIACFILTLFASMPATLETFFEFQSWGISLASATTSVTFLNLAIKNLWSLTNFYQHMRSIIHFYYAKQNELYNYLLALDRAIDCMPEQECDLLINTIQNANCGSALCFKELTSPYIPTIDNKNLNRKEQAAIALGFVIGIAGAWYSFKVPDEGMQSFLIWLNMSRTSTNVFAKFIASSSYIANAALFAYATGTSFLKFYRNLIKKLPVCFKNFPSTFCRTHNAIETENNHRVSTQPNTFNINKGIKDIVLPLLYAFTAFCGSAAVAEMTAESINPLKLGGIMLISASFIGMFSSKYWAISGGVKNHKFSQAPREKLKQVSNTLFYSVPTLKGDVINQLQNERYIDANESFLNDTKCQIELRNAR